MSDAKPFASLSPTLLARKGAARPAMRPQLQPLGDYPPPESHPAALQAAAEQAHDDLGWNDMGESEDQPRATVLAFNQADPLPPPSVPDVIREQHRLADRMIDALAPAPAEPIALDSRRPPMLRRSALADGRRAAFTLRVDGDRHLKLRLACTVEGRSAQQLMTEALDHLLDQLPGIDELARRVKRR